MVDIEYPYTLAGLILQAAADGLTAHGRTVPARRYVADGIPVWDCEQLTIFADAILPHQGNPFDQIARSGAAGCVTMQAAGFIIGHVRCVASATKATPTPSVAALDASGRAVLGDAAAIWDGIRNAMAVGTLPQKQMGFGSWQAIEPAGGFGGGTLRIIAGLQPPIL